MYANLSADEWRQRGNAVVLREDDLVQVAPWAVEPSSERGQRLKGNRGRVKICAIVECALLQSRHPHAAVLFKQASALSTAEDERVETLCSACLIPEARVPRVGDEVRYRGKDYPVVDVTQEHFVLKVPDESWKKLVKPTTLLKLPMQGSGLVFANGLEIIKPF